MTEWEKEAPTDEKLVSKVCRRIEYLLKRVGGNTKGVIVEFDVEAIAVLYKTLRREKAARENEERTTLELSKRIIDLNCELLSLEDALEGERAKAAVLMSALEKIAYEAPDALRCREIAKEAIANTGGK